MNTIKSWCGVMVLRASDSSRDCDFDFRPTHRHVTIGLLSASCLPTPIVCNYVYHTVRGIFVFLPLMAKIMCVDPQKSRGNPLPSFDSLLSPPLPFEVGPLNPAKWSGAEPQPKYNLVHFSLKI